MSLDIHAERRQAHDFLDRIPDQQVPAVRGLLESMLDPLSRKLAAAPGETEPITAREERSAAEAREWADRNATIPNEQILAELGLTAADFEEMGRAPSPPEKGEVKS